jgi:predicted Abi (CAAX) family protease
MEYYRLKDYLINNYLTGIKTSPLRLLKLSAVILLVYAIIAIYVLLETGIFTFQFLKSKMVFILPFSLFLFPSFIEESFFRGVLIPINTKTKGLKFVMLMVLMSATIFTLWHPLNGLTLSLANQDIFLNPYFLIIVFYLGVACSLSYIYSQSLWVPVIIHWLTVFIWVVFWGG